MRLESRRSRKEETERRAFERKEIDVLEDREDDKRRQRQSGACGVSDVFPLHTEINHFLTLVIKLEKT